jgi:hypothetical protein
MAAPAADEPMAAAPPKVDHEAPRKQAPQKSRKPRTTKRASKDTGQPVESPQAISERRAAGVESLCNVGAALCLGMSVRLGEAYKADAVVLSSSAAPMAKACTEVAEQDPRFAKILDKITASGPYAALAATAVPIVAQLAMNHGVTAIVL